MSTIILYILFPTITLFGVPVAIANLLTFISSKLHSISAYTILLSSIFTWGILSGIWLISDNRQMPILAFLLCLIIAIWTIVVLHKEREKFPSYLNTEKEEFHKKIRATSIKYQAYAILIVMVYGLFGYAGIRWF